MAWLLSWLQESEVFQYSFTCPDRIVEISSQGVNVHIEKLH